MKPIASLSLDLDNQWAYMKTHGDAGWESFPSYLDVAVPRILDFLKERNLKITFFIVGQDAALEKNHAAIRSIYDAGLAGKTSGRGGGQYSVARGRGQATRSRALRGLPRCGSDAFETRR